MTLASTTTTSGSQQTHFGPSRYLWALLTGLFVVIQMTVIVTLGTNKPGPALVSLGDLVFNLFCLLLVLLAAHRSSNLPRYFWHVTAVSVAFFCLAALCNI